MTFSLVSIRRQRIARSIPVIVAAATIYVVLWGIHAINSQGVGPLVSHLLNQTVTGSAEEAACAAQKLAALGDDGLAPLVKTLGNPRPSIAWIASNVLFERIEAWNIAVDDSDRFTQKHVARGATVVANALAACVDGFDPEARRTASRLALRLLALATRLPNAGDERLVICCDHVLETAGVPKATRVVDSVKRTPHSQSDVPRFASLSGGGLALETRGQYPGRLESPGRYRTANRGDACPLLSGTPVSPQLDPTARKSGLSDDVFHGKWRAWSNRDSGSTFASRPTGNAKSIPRPMLLATLAEMENFTLREVMERLHDKDPTIAAAAVEELAFRGLSEIEVALARQFTSPDTNVRRQLVDALPRAPGVDGRPWLFWLAEDSDAEVRLAALTVLATATDPNTHRRVLELALRDRDCRIAILAKQLSGK